LPYTRTVSTSVMGYRSTKPTVCFATFSIGTSRTRTFDVPDRVWAYPEPRLLPSGQAGFRSEYWPVFPLILVGSCTGQLFALMHHSAREGGRTAWLIAFSILEQPASQIAHPMADASNNERGVTLFARSTACLRPDSQSSSKPKLRDRAAARRPAARSGARMSAQADIVAGESSRLCNGLRLPITMAVPHSRALRALTPAFGTSGFAHPPFDCV
jgi:hypothetical protein